MDRPEATVSDSRATEWLLFDAAPVALVHLGADGRVQAANRAARALLGPAALAGRAWADETPGLQVRSQALDDGGRVLAVQPVPGVQAVPVQGTPATSATLADDRRPGPESQLALAATLSQVAIWRHDLATDRVHYNDQAWRLLGLAPRPQGLGIEEIRALTHPEDLPRVIESNALALRNSEPADLHVRYRQPDGRWRHVLTRRVLQRDAAGRPIAFLGVALDITERIEHERRAEAATRRFELVTRAAGIGYWEYEVGAERGRWSPELRALYALPDAEPVPTRSEWLARFVHPDDRSAVHRRLAQWMQGPEESLDLPMRILRPDGSVRHVATHTRRIAGTGAGAAAARTSGEGPAGASLFGIAIDLTERHEAELALRSAAESAALVARSVGLGTWSLDPQTGEARWDAQMWRLRGRPPQERAMSPEERRACQHPDDRETFGRILADAIERGTPVEQEFRVVWPDGSVHWLASRSLELVDEHSGQRRRIGVNWDVTDSRNAAAARQASELARRESQAKSRFLARMSHELRTPLNAVLGFSQLLLADDRGADPAAATRRRRLQHVRLAGQHLLTLINDVLDLSSLESGELRIALQPVALEPLVADTLPLLAPLRDRHRVRLRTGALGLRVMADGTRLRQVLLNLLTNAIKYNQADGEVLIEAAEQGSQVCLRVADTGPGLSPAQLEQLFEPFNRLGRGEGEAVEGTGIGLTIVKALVEHMGGTVQVHSRPGQGSVFEVRLATAAPGAVAESGPPTTAAALLDAPLGAPGGAQRRLLYIEDNPVNAMIIAELLGRRADLELQIAVDGASGVQQALARPPDLILLDMQLPDFDGFEVLRRLRAQPATAQVPCVALSANAMPEDIQRALQAGVADYWTKPLDFKAFVQALDERLGLSPP